MHCHSGSSTTVPLVMMMTTWVVGVMYPGLTFRPRTTIHRRLFPVTSPYRQRRPLIFSMPHVHHQSNHHSIIPASHHPLSQRIVSSFPSTSPEKSTGLPCRTLPVVSFPHFPVLYPSSSSTTTLVQKPPQIGHASRPFLSAPSAQLEPCVSTINPTSECFPLIYYLIQVDIFIRRHSPPSRRLSLCRLYQRSKTPALNYVRSKRRVNG